MRFKKWSYGVMLILLLGLAAPVQAQSTLPPKPGDVLFHETFDNFADPEQRVHPGWNPWFDQNTCNCEGNCKCFQPEFKQSNSLNTYPYRVHSGTNAQQYFTLYAGHDAGLWKQYTVLPGAVIEVHAWGMAWGSTEDDAFFFSEGQEMRMQIGVDPNGGTDPHSTTVIWGALGNPPNRWEEIPAVKVTVGTGGRITVFLRSNPKYPTKHNDLYWDDVAGVYLSGGLRPALPATNSAVGQPGTSANAGGKALAAPVVPDPILEGLVAGTEAPAKTGGPMTGLEILAGLLLLTGLMFLTSRKGEPVR